MKISLPIAAALAVGLGMTLTGCVSSSQTGAEALQALADAELPCEYPINHELSLGASFSCMDSPSSKSGFTFYSFSDLEGRDKYLTSLCDGVFGPQLDQETNPDELLIGENWLVSWESSKLADLKKLQDILGGNLESKVELCK